MRSAQSQLTDLQDRKTQDGKVQHQMRQDGPEEELGVVDVASGVGDRLVPESLHGNAIYLAIIILAIAQLPRTLYTRDKGGLEILSGDSHEP